MSSPPPPRPAPAPRVATDADVPAIVRVVNRAYHVEAFFLAGSRTTDDDVRARLAQPNAGFLVIDGEEAGALVGAVYVERRDIGSLGGHATRGYFGMLSVDPDAQGRGVGRALIDAAEAHCRAAGRRFLDISVVNLRTELPPFYAAFGFAPYDTAPFPGGEGLKRPAHLVLMTKPLAPLWGDMI